MNIEKSETPVSLTKHSKSIDDSDCVFIINGEEIRAHKLILTCCSPVFEKMFYGKMASDRILITDINLEDFTQMLDFIYTNNVTIKSVLHAWSLFYIAHKYLLDTFGDICTNYIEQNLCINNLVLNYEYAEMYGVERLQKICLCDIADYIRGIFSKNCDYHMKSTSLITILEQKTLNITSTELIIGVLNWTIVECDIRNISPSSDNIINLLNSLNLLQYLIELDFKINSNSDGLIQKTCSLMRQLKNVDTSYKHYLKKHWCIFCKCRQTYKIATRIEMRERDVLISNISVNQTTLLYGFVVATEDEPFGNKKSGYFGEINIQISDIDNSDPISETTFSRSFLYETPVYVPLSNVIPLQTGKIYSVKIRYKNLDCFNETGVSKSSILCNYMSSKLVDEKNGLVITFDELDGSVIRGISCYPA